MPATPPCDCVDDYLAGFPAEVRAVLEQVRQTIRAAAPDAEEGISYRIPAYRQGGVLVYFAAFKHHVGLYPPVQGDARLMKALQPYAGEKGNLRFPLDAPMPYDLIRRVVLARLRQLQGAAARPARPARAGASPAKARPARASKRA